MSHVSAVGGVPRGWCGPFRRGSFAHNLSARRWRGAGSTPPSRNPANAGGVTAMVNVLSIESVECGVLAFVNPRNIKEQAKRAGLTVIKN